MPGEKTEKASPKKRKDERKKGNIFQSKDVVTAASVLIIFSVLKLVFPFIYSYLTAMILRYSGYIKSTHSFSMDFARQIFVDIFATVAVVAGPLMLAAMVTGIIFSGIQTRFLVSGQSLKPKFSRISPLQGIKRLFSIRSVVELVKSILKAVIISAVLFFDLKAITKDAMQLMMVSVMDGVVFILDTVMGIVIKLSLVFFGIALFDYLYQWWEYERGMKMTKQEVKEEYKHTEGDPQVKGHIKEMQRKRSMQRMMQQVPTADVIVRNPTHYAVALKYDNNHNRAPIVVAKGQDQVALRIIAEGEKHGVPITENRPLARALYAQVDLNREIPPDYYAALAEILAWVYSLKRR